LASWPSAGIEESAPPPADAGEPKLGKPVGGVFVPCCCAAGWAPNPPDDVVGIETCVGAWLCGLGGWLDGVGTGLDGDGV
jgi:hypothetical protein